MGVEAIASEQPATGWRLKVGAGMFLFAIVEQFGVPVVVALGLSTALTASITAVLLVSGELIAILSIAVMGKHGYAYIKSRLFGILKQYGPPKEVGRLRRRISDTSLIFLGFWVRMPDLQPDNR